VFARRPGAQNKYVKAVKMKKIVITIAIAVLTYANGSCQNMNNQMNESKISIDLPLRGTWITPNTPGKKIPSHGIDKYSETYAYDFVGVDPNGTIDKFYEVSVVSYLLKGVPLEKCYGWGSNVYTPFDGEIVKIEDGVIERNPVNIKNDIRYMSEVTKKFERNEAKYNEVAGNYIIIISSNKIYALLAHLQTNSICVSEGEKVKTGQIIGRVGHSGNSNAPHLHFQLMDNIDPKEANGIPCSFANYEELRDGKWKKVDNGIPSIFRIRKNRY
jgi:hypothetical protein